MKRFTNPSKLSRRELIALTLNLTTWSYALAEMPIPPPASLEEQLTHWGNYLCTGTARPIVYLSKETGDLFLREGPAVVFHELEVFDKPNGGPAMLEVLNTKLIMVRPDAAIKESFPVRSYSFIGSGFPEIEERYRGAVGKEMIFVFKERLAKISQRKLAEGSAFFSTGGRTALDRFPSPIADLPKAIVTAQKLGYVMPR